jgi:dihydroneopterin triphosphate diphosphatase
MASLAANVVDLYAYRWDGSKLRFLALRRAPGMTLAGTWQAVSGLIEADETAWEAALRELTEETGLQARRLLTAEPLATFYVPWLDRVIIAPAFAAEVSPGEVVLSEEHDAYAWCEADEMIGRVEWPTQRAAIRELVAVLADPRRLALREIPLSGPRRPPQ